MCTCQINITRVDSRNMSSHINPSTKKMEKPHISDKLGVWIINFRWWFIAGILIFVSISAFGLQFLELKTDSRIWFGKNNPQLQALNELENTYTKINNVFIAIEPENGDVFTQRTLSAIEELTTASWQIPYSNRVDSITNFQHTYAEEDDLIVENLFSGEEILPKNKLDRIRKIALNDPSLVDRLISSKGNVTAININIVLPGKSHKETRETTYFVRNLLDNARQKYPDINFYLTGGIPFDNAFGEATEHDLSTLMPIMLLTLALVMWWLLRSLAAMIATMLVIIMSCITAMGLAGWLGIALNPASGIAPTIILTLAIADSIHILVTMLRNMQQGQTKQQAITGSLRINMHPVFITSTTTAIGFLSMNFSDAPPFHDLGNIVAIGVMAAWLFSIVFLPSIIAILPIRLSKPKEANSHLIDMCADFVISNQKNIFIGTIIAIILLVTGIPKIDLDDNFMKYLDESYEIRRASDFVQQNLTGMDSIEYSLSAGTPGGINHPEYMNTLEKFSEWYRNQPHVVHVNTVTEIIKRLNKNMHNDDESYYKIPENKNLAAQYMLLYEMSLPYGLDLNNQINIDKSATRVTVTLKDATAKELRNLDEKARNWLTENAPPSMFTYGSGLSVMFAHVSERNINSMLTGSLLALLLISVLLIIALKSFKFGLISLVPNLAPAFVAFGIWGYLVGKVGLAAAVLIALTLGIVVDDTVHFLSKYLRARRELSLNTNDAIRYTFHTVGTAMWVTTVVLVAGFSTLSTSGYKVNADMGILSALTIVLALLLDFLFLPTMLMYLDNKTIKRK